jgi:hypothetical protein
LRYSQGAIWVKTILCASMIFMAAHQPPSKRFNGTNGVLVKMFFAWAD